MCRAHGASALQPGRGPAGMRAGRRIQAGPEDAQNLVKWEKEGIVHLGK